MAKVVFLLLALLANACTTTTPSSTTNTATHTGPDDEHLRKMIEDRRTWIDPNPPL